MRTVLFSGLVVHEYETRDEIVGFAERWLRRCLLRGFPTWAVFRFLEDNKP
jgi:hypothetical protein